MSFRPILPVTTTLSYFSMGSSPLLIASHDTYDNILQIYIILFINCLNPITVLIGFTAISWNGVFVSIILFFISMKIKFSMPTGTVIRKDSAIMVPNFIFWKYSTSYVMTDCNGINNSGCFHNIILYFNEDKIFHAYGEIK